MSSSKSNDSRFVLRRLYYSPALNCRTVLARNETISIPTRLEITQQKCQSQQNTKQTEPTPRKLTRQKRPMIRIKVQGKSYNGEEGQDSTDQISMRTHYFARPSKFFHEHTKQKDDENDPPTNFQPPISTAKRQNTGSKPGGNILSSSSCYLNQFLANKIKAITVNRRNNYYSYLFRCAQDNDSSRDL